MMGNFVCHGDNQVLLKYDKKQNVEIKMDLK